VADEESGESIESSLFIYIFSGTQNLTNTNS